MWQISLNLFSFQLHVATYVFWMAESCKKKKKVFHLCGMYVIECHVDRISF